MNILTEAHQYQTQQEFELLTRAIQREIDAGNLMEYADKTWIRKRRPGWNGEYISTKEKKMYRFNGWFNDLPNGAPNYTGLWQIIREEKMVDGITRLSSEYKIREQEPGIFLDLHFEIEFSESEKTTLLLNWPEGSLQPGTHVSRLIQSATEFGIVSAFEDANPRPGRYGISIKTMRYHQLDSSFTLIAYAANRNLKRALFVEQEDEFPKIENGMISRKFRAGHTIYKYNNK
ncbi:MAG: hypothetical protein IT260_19765 [Saprospiraceae bacterium]|nr:hypothetical protein [Saprospiraceae bacterium]